MSGFRLVSRQWQIQVPRSEKEFLQLICQVIFINLTFFMSLTCQIGWCTWAPCHPRPRFLSSDESKARDARPRRRGCFSLDVAGEDKRRLYLVGGLEHLFVPYIGNLIIPTDFHILQRGGSTTNQLFQKEQYGSLMLQRGFGRCSF